MTHIPEVVAWTLGSTAAAASVIFVYVAARRRKTVAARAALYLALVATVFLGIAIALTGKAWVPAFVSICAVGILGLFASFHFSGLRRIRRHALVFALVGAAGTAAGVLGLVGGADLGIERGSDLTAQARVSRVIDGDTIVVLIRGTEYRVRYIGIDTPETVHPTRPVEPYGPEASEFNKKLVDGETVFLERDISQTDEYGRLLRYVWLEDELVNAVLVREGYAQVATFPPDVKYQDIFLKLQREAREKKRGLWGTGSY